MSPQSERYAEVGVWFFVAALAGCGTASNHSEAIGQSTEPLLTPTFDAGIGATRPNCPVQEPSGAFANARAFVVGFNDNVKTSGQSWAVSSDFGRTFNRQCRFDGTSVIGACAAVPLPTPPPGGEPFTDWAGDPTVVTDGRGNIVYVSLANARNTSISGGYYVVAAVSTNGGSSWASSSVVNFDPGGVDCTNTVAAGFSTVEDQPNAVFDVTTNPPTLWVVWRHFGSFAIAGACIRRGVIDPGGTLRWPGAPHTVNGLGGGYQDGLAVAAGDGVVTVMYAAANAFLPSSCPSGGTFPMDFATADTFNNGDNWSDNAQIFHSAKHQWCVIGGPPNSSSATGFVSSGQRPFGFVRAPGGIEYAFIQDTRHTARLFMSQQRASRAGRIRTALFARGSSGARGRPPPALPTVRRRTGPSRATIPKRIQGARRRLSTPIR